jgi:hypothetical protein
MGWPELFALIVVPTTIILVYTAWDARRTRRSLRLCDRTVRRLQDRHQPPGGTPT